MSEPHERLDEAMEERRLKLRMSWAQLARAAEISPQALRAIRRGEYRPSRLTAQAMDRALGWEEGSVEMILLGGEPVVEVFASDSGTATDEETKRNPFDTAIDKDLARAFASVLAPQQLVVQRSVDQVDFGIGDTPPFPEPRDDTELEANETWLAAKNLERVMQRQRERRRRRDIGDVG